MCKKIGQFKIYILNFSRTDTQVHAHSNTDAASYKKQEISEKRRDFLKEDLFLSHNGYILMHLRLNLALWYFQFNTFKGQTCLPLTKPLLRTHFAQSQLSNRNLAQQAENVWMVI